MEKITLYHGTDCAFRQIDLSRSLKNRDFGEGFYTTSRLAQAESWALDKLRSNGSESAYMYVYEAELTDDLRILRFNGYTEQWLEFVRKNRILGGICHSYDIVIGPLDHNDTVATVAGFVRGELSASDAAAILQNAGNTDDQISFHTQRAVACLHLQRMYTL